MTKEFKFDIGNEIYYIKDRKIANSHIIDIKFNRNSVKEDTIYYDIYGEVGNRIEEKFLFRTKEELLASL